MRIARVGLVSAVAMIVLLAGSPAMADPPPTNPNGNVFTFDCTRGSDTRHFQAIGIFQSAQISGQLLEGHGVIVFTHFEIDDQVVFDVPGQTGRTDLWTCTIAEVPGAVVDAFITPRG